MSEESSRRRKKRQSDPNSRTSFTGILVQFTDKVPSPDSPEFAEYQGRLNQRRLEQAADSPFIVDESKKPKDQPPT